MMNEVKARFDEENNDGLDLSSGVLNPNSGDSTSDVPHRADVDLDDIDNFCYFDNDNDDDNDEDDDDDNGNVLPRRYGLFGNIFSMQ